MNSETPTDCPLPNEILGYLRASDADQVSNPISSHLGSCPRCISIAKAIGKDVEPAPDTEWLLSQLNFSSSSEREVNPLRSQPYWKAASDVKPNPGQLWLAWDDQPRPGGGTGNRSIVLVLSQPVTQFGREWLTIAGVDEHVDAATSSDAKFLASESTLEMDIRVRTDFVAPVARNWLSSMIGELNTPCVRNLLDGTLEEGRYGRPLEADDWRVAVDQSTWRRWWDRRDTYDQLLIAAEDYTETLIRQAMLSWEANASQANDWRSLLSIVPGPEEPFPDPAVIARAITDGRTSTVDQVSTFWPLSVESLSSRIQAVSESRIEISGLPESLNGLSPVAALPVVAGWFANNLDERDQMTEGPTETVSHEDALTLMSWPSSHPENEFEEFNNLPSGDQSPWTLDVSGLVTADSPIRGGSTTITLPFWPPNVPENEPWFAGIELLPPISP